MAEDKSQDEVDSTFDEAAPEDVAPADVTEVDDAESGETPAGDDDYGDLDLEDIDFPDDDFDDDFDEDGEGGGGKKKWILIGSGVFVLVAIISGAAIFFLGGDDTEVAEEKSSDAVLSLAIPAKSKMTTGKMKMGRPADAAATQPSSVNSGSSSAPNQQAAVPSPQGNSAPTPNSNAPTAPPASNQAAQNQGTPAIASRPRTQAGAGVVLPSVTAASFKGIPMMQNPKPLPGPDRQLGESMGGGVVPKISADGRQPWQVYAKPFTGAPELARISIIIKGLGFSRAATIAAINHTPAEVTLAFDPYAKNVGDWVGLARTAGHETLITLPMEPDDFPISDPGPFALQTDLQQTENIDRLRYILSVSMGNVGLLQMMGTRFATSQQALLPVLNEVRRRGLLMVDDGMVKDSQIISIASTIALPYARSDIYLDENPSRLNLMKNLSALEALAQKNTIAVGIAQAFPTSISTIMNWTKTLASKKLSLAPVSATVKISGGGQPQAAAPQSQ